MKAGILSQPGHAGRASVITHALASLTLELVALRSIGTAEEARQNRLLVVVLLPDACMDVQGRS